MEKWLFRFSIAIYLFEYLTRSSNNLSQLAESKVSVQRYTTLITFIETFFFSLHRLLYDLQGTRMLCSVQGLETCRSDFGFRFRFSKEKFFGFSIFLNFWFQLSFQALVAWLLLLINFTFVHLWTTSKQIQSEKNRCRKIWSENHKKSRSHEIFINLLEVFIVFNLSFEFLDSTNNNNTTTTKNRPVLNDLKKKFQIFSQQKIDFQTIQ